MDVMNTTDSTERSTPEPEAASGTGTPPPPGGSQSQSLGGFFDTVRGLGITRAHDRWIGGVCSGLAKRLNVDPLIIRAAAIALLILGIGFVAYLIGWALLPDQDGSILAEDGIRKGDGWGIAILVVIAISVFGTGPWFGSGGRWFGLVLAIGFVAVLWYWLDQRGKSGAGGSPATGAPGVMHPPPASPAGSPTEHPGSTSGQPVWPTGETGYTGYEPPPTGGEHAGAPRGAYQASSAGSRPRPKRAGLAGLLLVLGATAIGYGIAMSLTGTVFAGLIGATAGAGLATILLGALGRRSVLSSLVSLGLAATLVGAWGADHVPQGGFGEALWRPTTAGTADSDGVRHQNYSWSFGSATLDLRGLEEGNHPDVIDASVSFGPLVIYVPEDLPTRIEATAYLGAINLEGDGESSVSESLGGTRVSQTYVFGEDEHEITVNASARFGVVRIITGVDPSLRNAAMNNPAMDNPAMNNSDRGR